jgi:hypothetical protein
MGFLTGIFSAVVKTALTPVAIVKDAANIVTGNEVDATKNLLEDAKDNVSEALDDLCDGDI